MALPNRLHTATYSFAGGEIKLQATMDALEALREDVQSDPIEYIGNALVFDKPTECVDHFKNIFYHLQVGDERESKASIYAWLFGVFEEFFTEANIVLVATAMAKIMGKDISEAIASYEESKAPQSRPKKVSSTASERQPAIS